jgi:hypothetical protein
MDEAVTESNAECQALLKKGSKRHIFAVFEQKIDVFEQNVEVFNLKLLLIK